MRFVLSIDLGNDAMQSHGDVARALEEVATRLHQGHDGAAVVDDNGNTVGRWSIDYENGDTP